MYTFSNRSIRCSRSMKIKFDFIIIMIEYFLLKATGIRIGTMLQNISNLGVGLILAFIYGWSLTLLMLAFIPFMIIAGFLQTYMMTGFADKVTINKKKGF